MIKGCRKEIYIVNDLKSDIFDHAIFVMKRNTKHISEISIKHEAERIIEEKTSHLKRNEKKHKKRIL